MNNRLWNCQNPHQGKFKKVLCVCSAGLLRSPTVAWVLSNPPYNCNTRAVGLDLYHALIPMDDVHMNWADIIVCMDSDQYDTLTTILQRLELDKPLINLGIPDMYSYRDPQLIEAIEITLRNKEFKFYLED